MTQQKMNLVQLYKPKSFHCTDHDDSTRCHTRLQRGIHLANSGDCRQKRVSKSLLVIYVRTTDGETVRLRCQVQQNRANEDENAAREPHTRSKWQSVNVGDCGKNNLAIKAELPLLAYLQIDVAPGKQIYLESACSVACSRSKAACQCS